MALSEIEKLERRYVENPQGLTFAPLAEVHRKNGDVARALELLRSGLTIHPDYIPASIVLGRCHLDLGDLQAAEAAFSHVLDLDGENVIALKAMAEISERLFRFDEAERLLHTLLAIDRSNDEARDQLGRVEAARRQAETASSAAPEVGMVVASDGLVSAAEAPADELPAPDAAAPEPVGFEAAVDEELVSATASLPEMSHPPIPEPPADRTLDWVADLGGAEVEETVPLTLEAPENTNELVGPPPEGIELEQPITLEAPVQPLAGLVGRDDRVGAAEHVDATAEHLDAAADFLVETDEDIVLESSGGGEFRVADAALELEPSRGRSEPAPFLPAPPIDFGPAPAEAEPPAPPPAPWAVPIAEPPRQPEPDLVITESMAELLLQQGHRDEALVVYRHLESRGAGDARFQEKIAELESVPTAPEAPVPAYSVVVTHGQSVQAYLRSLLGARPPAPAGGPPVHAEPSRTGATADREGAPTRPAQDSLSLSSVFGEESTPTPPAVPAAGAGGPGPSGVSYDDFFGAPGTSATPRPPRASEAKSDDLDQFHAWLQNLKR